MLEQLLKNCSLQKEHNSGAEECEEEEVAQSAMKWAQSPFPIYSVLLGGGELEKSGVKSSLEEGRSQREDADLHLLLFLVIVH